MKVFTTNNESVYNRQWKCLQQIMTGFTTNNESVYNKWWKCLQQIMKGLRRWALNISWERLRNVFFRVWLVFNGVHGKYAGRGNPTPPCQLDIWPFSYGQSKGNVFSQRIKNNTKWHKFAWVTFHWIWYELTGQGIWRGKTELGPSTIVYLLVK